MNPNAPHITSLAEMFFTLIRNRRLVTSMCKREILSRYRGSLIGTFWAFATPIFMLSVYVFIFGIVFKSRWGQSTGDSKVSFAMILFVGLILFDFFVNSIQASTALITSNVNYVKKVVFPLEVLPWVIIGSGLFDFCIKLIVLLIALLIVNHSMCWTIIFFPLILIPLFLTTVGLCWFLAATGVFLLDVAHTVNVFTFALIFVSGVFFPISSMPIDVQAYARCNIIAFLIEESRKILIFNQCPNWIGLCIAFGASLLIAWFGFWWFQKLRKGFSDVL